MVRTWRRRCSLAPDLISICLPWKPCLPCHTLLHNSHITMRNMIHSMRSPRDRFPHYSRTLLSSLLARSCASLSFSPMWVISHIPIPRLSTTLLWVHRTPHPTYPTSYILTFFVCLYCVRNKYKHPCYFV